MHKLIADLTLNLNQPTNGLKKSLYHRLLDLESKDRGLYYLIGDTKPKILHKIRRMKRLSHRVSQLHSLLKSQPYAIPGQNQSPFDTRDYNKSQEEILIAF